MQHWKMCECEGCLPNTGALGGATDQVGRERQLGRLLKDEDPERDVAYSSLHPSIERHVTAGLTTQHKT